MLKRSNTMRVGLLDNLSHYDKLGLLKLIKSDAARYRNIWGALQNVGFYVVMTYRIAHFLHKHHLDFFASILQIFSVIFFNSDISRKMRCGPNLAIFHATGVFIAPDVRIGAGAILGKGCFIGALNKAFDPDDCPVLGNNVTVGTGAVVLGGIAIGDQASIGPNTVIMKNVPPNYSVLPEPVHMIKKFELKPAT